MLVKYCVWFSFAILPYLAPPFYFYFYFYFSTFFIFFFHLVFPFSFFLFQFVFSFLLCFPACAPSRTAVMAGRNFFSLDFFLWQVCLLLLLFVFPHSTWRHYSGGPPFSLTSLLCFWSNAQWWLWFWSKSAGALLARPCWHQSIWAPKIYSSTFFLLALTLLTIGKHLVTWISFLLPPLVSYTFFLLFLSPCWNDDKQHTTTF